MKSWVSSAFGELGGSTSSSSQTPSSKSSSRTIRTPATASRNTQSTTRTTKTFEAENVLRSQQPAAGKKLGAQRSPLRDKTNELGLSDKYAPTSRSDLVVNKSKVDQLSSLIDDLVARKRGSILLIDGPTGCGKTVSYSTLLYCL